MNRNSLGQFARNNFITRWYRVLSLRRKFYLWVIVFLACIPLMDKAHSFIQPRELVAGRVEALELEGLTGDRLDRKIAELKTEVLDLLSKCESGSREGDEADSLVTYDPDKSGKQGNIPSLGRFQFKIATVQHYVQKFEKRAITRTEAIQVAIDGTEARKLAERVIFEDSKGLGNWVICTRNYNLEDKVALIERLEE